jgi:hypothetical protein
LCLILQHEICALASFWYGSGNQFSDEAAPRQLWPQNNMTRQSPIDGDRDRLTVRENWGQIGAAAGDFAFFVELALLFWEMHSCAAHRGFHEHGIVVGRGAGP